MSTLAIIGTGGFGKQILPMAQQLMQCSDKVVTYAETNPASDSFGGIPLVAIERLIPGAGYVAAIANPQIRAEIASLLERQGLSAKRLISPLSRVAKDNDLGAGAIVCDFAVLEAFSMIGAHFQANVFSFVAHECVIGDYVTFGPRATCNGNVHIGDAAYIGAGAVIRQGSPERPLTIGRGATIGMGAVVTKDVAAGAVVVGNPAKPLVR